jgi:hypothetical protein
MSNSSTHNGVGQSFDAKASRAPAQAAASLTPGAQAGGTITD